MRPLIAGHFDRMAHLDHVEPIGFERVGGEPRQIGGCRRLDAAHHPPGESADHESGKCSRGGRGDPAVAAAACHASEVEPLRHLLVDDAAVACPEQLGLLAPGGDAGRVIGMRREPGLDRAATVGRQFAVDIGVQFVFADHLVSVSHRSLSYFTRRSAGRSPSR